MGPTRRMGFRPGWITALSIFAAVVILWLAWAVVAAPLLASHFGAKVVALGQTGDIFGGASAFFSALAFAGVAISAYLQREQLDHERDARSAADAAALEDRERAQHQYARQAFEPLFFKLIELFRAQSKTMHLRISDSGVPVEIQHFDQALVTIRRGVERRWGFGLLVRAAWTDAHSWRNRRSQSAGMAWL